jgi:hypothetical protein
MRITGIDVVELRVPGWTAATFDGSYDNCVIRLFTDAGIEGIAEVDSVPAVIRAIIEAPPLIPMRAGSGTWWWDKTPSTPRRCGSACTTPRAITAGEAPSSMP